MHEITIEHKESHTFTVSIDGISVSLSYRSFGGRKAVDTLGEEGLAQLICESEQTIVAQDFSTGIKCIFQTIGVSNAMEILCACCGDAFRAYWQTLLLRRKALGQGHSFRNMLAVVSGTKATLAQNSSPFVEEMRELCRTVQSGTADFPVSSFSTEEISDANICVSFLFQENNSLTFSINRHIVSLCTRQISDIKTSVDMFQSAQLLRATILSCNTLNPHIDHWGGSFVFRVLHAVCPRETVSYFHDYAQKQMQNRILLDSRRMLKTLRFPFNDRSLTSFGHELLSALEQHKTVTGTVLTAGNLHVIRTSLDKWTLYFNQNLATHYRNINFTSIIHPLLRKEAAQFLKAFASANGDVNVQQIARYFYLLHDGLNALADTSIGSIKDVSLHHARFVKSRLDRTCRCSASQISEALQVLGRMYHWAVPECTEDENPFWRITIPNKGAFLQTTPPANPAALKVIADHLDELPEHVQIGHQLLLMMGSRAHDAFSIRVADLEFLDDGEGYLSFQSSKNHRRMRFHIPTPLAVQLKDYIKKTKSLRDRFGKDYLLLYMPVGRRSNSASLPMLLTYDTYNYYIKRLLTRYAPALTLTTRRIRAEVGRRYHSEGLSSSQVAIALGNSPTVARRHYRTLSPRDEAELYHRRYTTYFAAPPVLASEATTPHPMWGSCDNIDCQHRSNCHACPYLFISEVNLNVPCEKSS